MYGCTGTLYISHFTEHGTRNTEHGTRNSGLKSGRGGRGRGGVAERKYKYDFYTT
jgi:hypothetical protein